MNLTEHEHFALRVIQESMSQALPAYWERRAAAYQAAMGREGDFTGRATPEALEAQSQRQSALALACRNHARLMHGGDLG